jgi:glutamate dehydrogenase (NADP+)
MNGGNFMEKSAKHRLDNFMNGLARRNPGQSEFHQAVYEVAVDIIP